MIALSTIHESKLTKFHRNHIIFSVSDLPDTSIFKGKDLDNEQHISIEECRRLFPKANNQAIASLLFTYLHLKIAEGERNFLFVFNDENREVSFDVINGLVQILDLEPSTEEQEQYFAYLRTYALEWTHLLLAEKAQDKMTFRPIH